MTWYAAHSIMSVIYLDGIQDGFSVWENVILINASSDEEALEKAKIIAREGETDPTDVFTWEGRPASIIFAGIRKLITCNDPDEQPTHGVEITYSQMEVNSSEDLAKLINGEEVVVNYTE